MQQAKLVLTAMSAADFYRLKFPAFTAPDTASFSLEGPCAYRDDEVRALAPFWLDDAFTEPESGTVHVLTRSAAERGNAQGIRAHVWSGEFPPGSFFEYNADVVIASPEFAFLQLATELTFEQLVAYGDELCGCYSLSPADPSGFRVRKVPLTTAEKLSSFVASAEGMRGYRQASKALPCIVDGSRTPDDTAVEMLACLSYHRGGYCLPRPALGHSAKLSKRASLLMGADEALVGICWPDAGACLEVVERASRAVSGPKAAKAAMDAENIRKTALGFSGLRVFEVTRAQVSDLDGFESCILPLAEALGKRIPHKKRGPLPQREHLRSTLLAWNSAHGHTQ